MHLTFKTFYKCLWLYTLTAPLLISFDHIDKELNFWTHHPIMNVYSIIQVRSSLQSLYLKVSPCAVLE